VHDDFWFFVGGESEVVEVVDACAGGDGGEVEGVGVEVDVLGGHADFGHGVFFISDDVFVPAEAEFDGGTGVLADVEVVAGFPEAEGVVFWDVFVGGVAADDVDDGGVGVAGVVDGAVAVVEVAVGCPEDGGEFVVGGGLGGVGAVADASADGLFHDHVDGDGWW